MTKFMYLFRSSPESYRSLSPDEMQRAMQKWIDWKASLEKNGHIVSFGDRLDGTGKVVRGKSKTVTDGPFVEVKDCIQGYLVVQAQDIDHAARLASGCPVLDREGTVEIRPFFTA
jgi:hypothetical protein